MSEEFLNHIWKSPTLPSYDHDGETIDKIKSALKSSRLRSECPAVVVQFWAAEWREGQCFLSTSGQPFDMNTSCEELCSYRKACETLKFSVMEEDEVEVGVLCRVFRKEWFESTPNVGCYSDREYPQRQLALKCNLESHLAVPVLETSTQNCVGVLEFLAYRCVAYGTSTALNAVWPYLQRVDLELGMPPLCRQYFPDQHSEMSEILKMMKIIHKVCWAQAWVACKNCSAQYTGLEQLCLVECLIYDSRCMHFFNGCRMHHLLKGQGLVGKAYLSGKPCFCRDVTQFNPEEYPLVSYARHAGLAQSFAICLHHTYTDNYYILELFFNPGDCEDPHYFLGSLMKTLQKFPKFKLDFSEELADQELYVEVIQPPCQTIESQRLPGTPHIVDSNSSPASSNQRLMVEVENASSGSVDDFVDAKESNAAPSHLQETSTEIPITYETLAQHFGRKLGHATESLGVSRSTLKRICRQHGISRWKPCKRNRVTHLQSKRDPPFLCPLSYTTMQVARRSMTIKANYGSKFLKFELPFSSGMVELEEQLSKRLKSIVATCDITYLDDEGDLILIACDEDLQNYMGTCRSWV